MKLFFKDHCEVNTIDSLLDLLIIVPYQTDSSISSRGVNINFTFLLKVSFKQL